MGESIIRHTYPKHLCSFRGLGFDPNQSSGCVGGGGGGWGFVDVGVKLTQHPHTLQQTGHLGLHIAGHTAQSQNEFGYVENKNS